MTDKQPQPVLTAASIAAAVHSFAAALGFLGLATWQTNLNGEAEAIGTVVVFAITVGAHFIPALAVRAKVTPVAKPKDDAGNALAPAGLSMTVDSAAIATLVATPVAPRISDDEDPDPELDADEPETVSATDEPHLLERLAGNGPQHAAPDVTALAPLVTGTAAPVQTPARPVQGDFVPPAAG